MSLNALKRGPLPQDVASAYQVLDGMTGSRAATLDLINDLRWPGLAMSGAGALRRRPIRFAQAATGTMSDVLPTFRGLTIPKGAVLIEGVIVTAAIVLTEIDNARERAAVNEVIQRYGLNRSLAADMLAARAYVWTVNYGPWKNWAIPYSGPANTQAAESVMRYEQSHPGTVGLAVSGRSREADDVLTVLLEDAVPGITCNGAARAHLSRQPGTKHIIVQGTSNPRVASNAAMGSTPFNTVRRRCVALCSRTTSDCDFRLGNGL